MPLADPLNPPNPTFNPFMPSNDQVAFLWIHYADKAKNPIEMLQWLYAMADYNEQ